MATYEEYVAQGVDPATARAWADADAEEELDDHWTGPASVQPATHPAQDATTVTSSPGDLNDLFHELQLRTGPAPNPAIGRDATGMVAIHVDQGRTPVRLELRTNWADELGVEALPAAILTAYSVALDIQYEEARDAATVDVPQQPSMLPSDFGVSGENRGTPRPPESIGADVQTAWERAQVYLDELEAGNAAASADESAPRVPRTMTMRLEGPWLVDCQVNPEWAAEAAAARIMNEFSLALQHAKEAQSTAPSPMEREKQELVAEFNSLSQEALAALRFIVNNAQ